MTNGLHFVFRWAVNGKLLECEGSTLRITMIQLAAIKTLATLFGCNKYSELLLDPDVMNSITKDEVSKYSSLLFR